MKRIIALAVAFAAVLAFAACSSDNGSETTAVTPGDIGTSASDAAGETDLQTTAANTQAPSQSTEDTLNGYTGAASASLEGVNGNNYASVAESIFGIRPIEKEGWALEYVESPNGVNNLDIVYSGNTVKGKVLAEEYFTLISAASTNGIYAQKLNEDGTGLVRGEKCSDFATYFAAEGTEFYGATSAMWIYDFGGKSIQFSLTANEDDTTVEIILTILA